MVLGMLIFQFFPTQLLGIFNASENMEHIGVLALRIISISFLFAGFNIVSSSLFQSMAHGVLSLWVSVVRQLCVLLPAAFLLSRIGGLDMVWWCFPISEIFALVMCIVFQKHVYKKQIAPLGEE